MSGLWWTCHWCDWEAPIRWWPRWIDTFRFKRHLGRCHPEKNYQPWKNSPAD
jgi:hypothetical protein